MALIFCEIKSLLSGISDAGPVTPSLRQRNPRTKERCDGLPPRSRTQRTSRPSKRTPVASPHPPRPLASLSLGPVEEVTYFWPSSTCPKAWLHSSASQGSPTALSSPHFLQPSHGLLPGCDPSSLKNPEPPSSWWILHVSFLFALWPYLSPRSASIRIAGDPHPIADSASGLGFLTSALNSECSAVNACPRLMLVAVLTSPEVCSPAQRPSPGFCDQHSPRCFPWSYCSPFPTHTWDLTTSLPLFFLTSQTSHFPPVSMAPTLSRAPLSSLSLLYSFSLLPLLPPALSFHICKRYQTQVLYPFFFLAWG